MTRMLVPTDFSEGSLEAVRYGVEYTYAVGGDMLLLHVVEAEPLRSYAGDGPSEALGRAYIRFGIENPVYYQLIFMQRTDLLFRHRVGQTPSPIESFNILQEAVQQALEAGMLQRGDAETYSQVLWALVHGITSLAVAQMPRFTAQALEPTVNTALHIALEGLRRR